MAIRSDFTSESKDIFRNSKTTDAIKFVITEAQ